MKKLTPEEQKQVQSIINARTKIFTEQISRQEAQISMLTSQLDAKDQELSGLRTQLEASQTQLAESQKLTASLQAELQQLKSRPATQPVIIPALAQTPEPPKPEKPSYLAALLRQHFALDSFRPGQEDVIDAILSGRDIFCSMPEHYGKSICYRLPALLMPGLTLVISSSEPDASQPSPHTEYLLSSDSQTKRRALLRSLKNGTGKILYSSLSQLTSDEITSALRNIDISFAAITDTKILKPCTEFLDSLGKKRTARGIFTSASSPADRQEFFRLLRSPAKVITGYNNPCVSLKVLRSESKPSALRKLITEKAGMPGVIFCSTPEGVFKIRETLRDYEGIDDRITILPARMHEQVQRRDIRFIVHYDLPENLAAYSREISIAGLDGSKAECIMLVSRKELLNADNSVVKFCSAKKPKDFLLSYVGEDEKFASQPEQPKDGELTPEDFSDFDFGTANEAQKEAITSANGPMLIIAGPGTGKTYTLIQRAVFLIQKKHVKPENIMLATFTDKAAQELITRISEALSSRKILADTGSMYTGTFHALCSRILEEYADFTGLGKTFRILDDFGHAYTIMQNFKRFEAIPAIDRVFKNSGKWKRSCELRDYINSVSEELIDPEELIGDTDPAVSALGQAMKLHDEILRESDSMSYSALLAQTYRLLRNNPEILESLQQKIQYIMIDEYQDTNYVQEQLVFLLGSEHKNICVVGDDDQSLYRFRGATVRNILEFPDKFGKNECKIVRLMLNYRSTPAIVEFASRWMENTGEFFSWENFRHPKKLEAHKPEAAYPSVMRLADVNDIQGWHEKILTFIKSLKDSEAITDYSQIAFLFRSVKSKNVQELAQFLESSGISVYSPRSNLFFDRGEIKFAIGCIIAMFPEYLKSLESGAFTDSESIKYYRSCLQNLSRYIDKPAYSGLKRYLLMKRSYHAKFRGYTGYTYSNLLYELFAFEPFTHALNAQIAGNARDLRTSRNLSRLVQVFRDYERSYNVNNISSKYMASQFQMMMNIYIRFRIDEGLDEYESDTESIPAGHVAFMTIHQAKGREFPIVFVDSLWSKPDSELQRDRNNELMTEILSGHSRRPEFEPQESIKLFDFWRMYYVAFTRAQNLLVLTCNENNITPSKYLEGAYNRLEDADDIFTPSALEVDEQKDSELRNTYSFTSDILTYESCPMQYKFFCELEFPQTSSQMTLLGKLVHATIEDIHRAVLNQETQRITEPNISEWFSENYERLSRTELAYLNENTKKAALAQVMHYVNLQGDDWNGIVMTEAEVNLVREEYILDGKIDLVRIRDGMAEIIDFKSGNKPNMNISKDRDRLEDCRRQVNVYAYLAAHALGLGVSEMKLYYTGEKGKNPEIVYPYDEEEAERVVKGFDEVVRKIQAADFEHRTEDIETCSECQFRYHCRKDTPRIKHNVADIQTPE